MSTARPWWLWRRLAWRQAGALLAAILLAAALVAWRTVATIRSLDDASLQSQAALVAGQLETRKDGAPMLRLTAAMRAAFAAADGENAYLVVDAGNQVRLASAELTAVVPYLPASGLFRVPPTPLHPAGLVGAVVASGPWRVAVVQAAEQQEALLESLLRDFLISAVWLLLPLAVGTVAIGIATMRRGLRPVREVSAAAKLIGPQHPGGRLPGAGLPAELAPLVAATNGALARLERALDAQRRFVAEAAHALRTPLAVLTARIDMLDPGPDRAALTEDANRMARLVGQMLTMSRLEELPLDVAGTVDYVAVAMEAVSARAPLAIGRGVALALLRPNHPIPGTGDHDALVLALGNLIDNAMAHAPAGSEVETTVDAGGFSVADRGRGVPEAAREAIFTRFARLPGAPPGGAGLGLAIVARVAAAHGGTASVADRPGGGAVFRLSLPSCAR